MYRSRTSQILHNAQQIIANRREADAKAPEGNQKENVMPADTTARAVRSSGRRRQTSRRLLFDQVCTT